MTEFETIGLEPVESLTITTLVDNVTDILLLDEGPAIRAQQQPSFLLAGGLLVVRGDAGVVNTVRYATAPAGGPSTRSPPASPTPTYKPASAPASSFTATSDPRK